MMPSTAPTALTTRTAVPTPPALTVYYDGGCPICSAEIATYRRQVGAEACAWVDASRGNAATLGPGLDAAGALARMHVRRADGTLVSGAAAFIEIWKTMPATRWLGAVASVPPVPWLLERGYRAFLVLRPLWRRADAAGAISPVASSSMAPASATAARAAKAMVPVDVITERTNHANPDTFPEASVDGITNGITPALWAELRSDHAGEAGAVMIYRGMLAATRRATVRDFAARHLATETEHLRLVEAWVPPPRRSRLLPAWRLAGWLTGALPALLGPRAVFVTIAAVETFVDRHYAQQLALIDALPHDPARAELRALLARCQADEVHHRDEAHSLAGDATRGMLARGWAAVVGSGSEVAVALARRL